MKSLRRLITVVSIIASPLAAFAGGEGKPTLDEARVLLEKGRAAGALPEGMVIRVNACLGELKESDSKRLPIEMRESWEFTSAQVRDLSSLPSGDRDATRRPESRSFDSKGLCKDLLEGKALEIAVGKGSGPKTGLIGTPYGRGSRSIEVVWKGKTILDLHETNGPTLMFYRESDARAFGALYERLATQARALFAPKPATSK